MEFSLNAEQEQLKDTLQKYLQKTYSFDARRQQIASAAASSATHWRAFAEFGILGLGTPEACGGLGDTHNIGGEGSFVEDSLVVMESFGRALVAEPYLASAILATSVLRTHVDEPACAERLAAMASGNAVTTLAVQERAGRAELGYVATSATHTGAGYVLSGSKSHVLNADAADVLIVSARTAGADDAAHGVSLFMVSREAAGVSVRAYPTNDGHRAAEVTLLNVALPNGARIGAEHAALPTITHAVEFGMTALCAEAVGAMAALVEQTLEYVKTRKQFGVPIGTFQVLQHRLVDMFIATEQARSITLLAAMKVTSANPAERARCVSAAKALVGQSARYVGQQAVQMHGGMGVTDELPISHYFRRLTAIDLTFGDATTHRARLGDLIAA
jgi:alkylation response protein AidB-like acyl-CoA dehydrogenase